VKITLEDALPLLSKYAEEQTRALAVCGTPSLSIARVTGAIHVPVKDADFHGDNAKLEWVVSLDGKKMRSETYKILAILRKPRSDQR
jgi:hypothetical protein